MSPYETFQVIFEKLLKPASGILGYDILKPNFKFSVQTCCTVAFIVSQFFFCCYTILVFNAETSWKCASCMSLGLQVHFLHSYNGYFTSQKITFCIQGMVKSYCVLKYRPQIVFLVSYLDNIFKQNVKTSKSNHETLEECTQHSYYSSVSLFVLYMLCGVFFCFYPVIAYMIFRITEPALPIYLPAIDFYTKSGYIITTTYHFYMVIIAVLGLAFCDALFINLVYNLTTMAGLLVNQLNELDRKLVKRSTTEVGVKAQLRNIFIMHFEWSELEIS